MAPWLGSLAARWLGSLAACAFCYALALPLEGSSIPAGFLALLGLATVAWLLPFAWRGEWDTRLCATISLSSLLHLLLVSSTWSSPPLPLVASRLAEELSRTTLSVPAVAVLHGWAMLCLGLVVGRALLDRPKQDNPPRAISLLAYGVGTAVGLFGVRAVIGYATGSLSLVPA